MSESTENRREAILTQIYEKGRVAVRELADELNVSIATARRDLKSLAGQGQVELVYGGATLMRTTDFSFHSKGTRNMEAKRVIGRMAAELIGNHDQIFMDSGTTCFQTVFHVKRKQDLTIIANSARLAMELDMPGLNTILLGGQYRPDRMDTVGPLAIRTLENLRGYMAFIGVDGLSMDFGLTASDIESAHLHALAVANARETILLADHTKFLTQSLYKIVDFDAISRVITDMRPTGEWMEFLDSHGVEVLYPTEEVE